MPQKGIIIIIIFFVASFSYADTKSDNNGKVFVPLPGISEKVNSEDIIQKLLYVKKIPIQKKESELQDYKIENDIIKDFTKYLRDLDAKSRGLYDFQSPFRDMSGESSDSNILEAAAGRKSKKQSYKITVLQTAKPDSFMSESVSKNKILSPSEFSIESGSETNKIKFMGGSVYQLFTSLQQQAGKKIEVKVVNDTIDTSILVISGIDTGEKNKINFDGDLKTLFEIGMLVNGTEKPDEYTIDFTKINSDNSNLISGESGNILIKPGNEGLVNLIDSNYQVREKTMLIYGSKINPLQIQTNTSEAPLPEIDISVMEGVKVSNITVGGGSLITVYEEKKEAQKVVSNFTDILTIFFNDGTKKTYSIDGSGSFTNSLSQYKDKKIEKLTVKNDNTDREIALSGVKFSTKPEEGGIQPKNPISKACDSIVNLDGVEARRNSNKIEDLIDGVTLSLKKESKDPVNINIDHNYQKISDSILAWVDSYNKAMEYLSILTKPTKDMTPLSEKNQQNLKEGVFQVENSFIMLRYKLRDTAINAYKTDYGRELSLLDQIGIFTKKAGSFSTTSDEWTSTKMGLLTTDGEKLKSVLKVRFDGVEQLFANDTTGSQTKDTGVAVAVNQSLKLAIGSDSFIDRRIAFNDNRIKDCETEIEGMNKDLSDYEALQRQKYGRMNQALTESDSKQKWLNSQFKNQQ